MQHIIEWASAISVFLALGILTLIAVPLPRHKPPVPIDRPPVEQVEMSIAPVEMKKQTQSKDQAPNAMRLDKIEQSAVRIEAEQKALIEQIEDLTKEVQEK